MACSNVSSERIKELMSSSSTSMRPCPVHDQAKNQHQVHQVQKVHFSFPSLLTLGIIVLPY
jgi:hypothetical protein